MLGPLALSMLLLVFAVVLKQQVQVHVGVVIASVQAFAWLHNRWKLCFLVVCLGGAGGLGLWLCTYAGKHLQWWELLHKNDSYNISTNNATGDGCSTTHGLLVAAVRFTTEYIVPLRSASVSAAFVLGMACLMYHFCVAWPSRPGRRLRMFIESVAPSN